MIVLKDLKRFTDSDVFENIVDGGDFEKFLAEQIRSFLQQNWAIACNVEIKK